MSRRVSLPGADELFRRTGEAGEPAEDGDGGEQPAANGNGAATTGQHDDGSAVEAAVVTAAPEASTGADGNEAGDAAAAAVPRRPSGRVRHDEKMTVYVTADELLDLEHARLTMRRHHGVAVDRGRLVREAISIVLADLDRHGADSALVRRLHDA